MLDSDTLTSGLCHTVVDTDGPDTEVRHGGAWGQYLDKRQGLTVMEKESKKSPSGVLTSGVSATSAFHKAICFPLY